MQVCNLHLPTREKWVGFSVDYEARQLQGELIAH
jgi:hypothetical protein